MLFTLVLVAALAALAGTMREAEAASPEKIVFVSDRAKGTGVNNPTGDTEIFKMNPDGTGVRQPSLCLIHPSAWKVTAC